MKFRVAQVGVGVRGKFHLRGLLENSEYFEVVGICDLDMDKLRATAESFHLDVPVYTDAETMLKETKPDVFVFVTHPDVRVSMIDLAVKYNIKVLSFEKPMAINLQDARYITEVCKKNNIKAVISHQQKYAKQFQAISSIVRRGEIGEICKIHVETQSWLAQLGTHYIDYAMWINGGKAKVTSVVGHAHGSWMLDDSHPSPDYILGEAKLSDGVRIYLECGYFSERRPYVPRYGYDNRLTVYGTHGYVWAETDGKWGGFTKTSGGELVGETFEVWDAQEPFLQIPYYSDLADWLLDENKVHPCNIDISYHGYEVLEGLCLSALNYTKIDFPLTKFDYEPVLERMAKVFEDVDSPRRRTWIEYMD